MNDFDLTVYEDRLLRYKQIAPMTLIIKKIPARQLDTITTGRLFTTTWLPVVIVVSHVVTSGLEGPKVIAPVFAGPIVPVSVVPVRPLVMVSVVKKLVVSVVNISDVCSSVITLVVVVGIQTAMYYYY